MRKTTALILVKNKSNKSFEDRKIEAILSDAKNKANPVADLGEDEKEPSLVTIHLNKSQTTDSSSQTLKPETSTEKID